MLLEILFEILIDFSKRIGEKQTKERKNNWGKAKKVRGLKKVIDIVLFEKNR